ncbi:vacuolar amino acid transporter, putative [Perkinsus marinus ATCC 50983]|uniref:Vacuolar amino acid transporter, putative n=1 Tax=Perkinsus marinus (strain ATCC 50983 / TXsc) TaxID=423536 RepID=C5L2J3_PERM5|nr:vacuolar amino acid transporter, putative [Perkinsus marinus ATCC 50983]EER09087.1 vacuolar amino acid transporter, putative [Perkinsus marinus ATCC 50983]|eukprot:XP_002777271.1 vacuolar amino acid transporter, putative [Perkinsus marinus ATCC 50983]
MTIVDPKGGDVELQRVHRVPEVEVKGFDETVKGGDVDPQCHHGKCTDIRGVFSIVLSAIGMGVVMLPTVFASCGWLGGAFVLTLGVLFAGFAVSKLYMGIALTPKGRGHVYTYEDLGRACYGKWGRALTAAIVHVTMSGICASLLVLLGENTTKLIPSVSQRIWIIIWAVFFIPFTFLRTMHEVSYVAAVGMVSILTLFTVVSANGLLVGITSKEPIVYDIFVPDFIEIATNFGVCILSFNVTNSVATLVRDMAKPTHFVAVSRWAYGIIFTVYFGIGVCGYFGYGRSLRDHPIMDSIVPPNEPVSGAWAYITLIAIVMSSVPHYVVLLLPIASSLEYVLNIDVDDNSRRAGIKRFLARLACILFTTIIAVSVPNISSLLDILGSFTMVFMVAMMPCIYYMRIQQIVLGSLRAYVKAHKAETVFILVVLTWCVPMIAVGSYGAIKNFG